MLKDLKSYYDKADKYYIGKYYKSEADFVKFHPFVCNVRDHKDDWVIFEVCDQTQEYGSAIYDNITREIIKELSSKIEKNFEVEGEDGDICNIFVNKIKYE